MFDALLILFEGLLAFVMFYRPAEDGDWAGDSEGDDYLIPYY